MVQQCTSHVGWDPDQTSACIELGVDEGLNLLLHDVFNQPLVTALIYLCYSLLISGCTSLGLYTCWGLWQSCGGGVVQ